MKELPIEFTSRLRQITQQLEIDFADDSNFEFISKMIMLNKIVYITEMPTFDYNNRRYQCPTFKIDSIEELEQVLNREYNECKIFCFYKLFQSPTMYNPGNNFSASRSMMLRGDFIPKPDGFELREIIDRDKQIEKILN